jgi:hypothetical protein
MHPLKKISSIFNRFRKVTPPEPIHGTGDKFLMDTGDSLIIFDVRLEGYMIKNGIKIPYYHYHERGAEHTIEIENEFSIKVTFTSILIPPEPKK